jgi:hypothetical protein
MGEGAGAETPVSTPSVGGGETPAAPAKPRCKPVNRAPMTWAAIDVERLVPPDHLVRAIWELVGRLDLSRFWVDSKAVEGVAGCSPYDPRLLISLWVLAYSDAISSARAQERAGHSPIGHPPPPERERLQRHRPLATTRSFTYRNFFTASGALG